MPCVSISSCGTAAPRPPKRLSASCSATTSASIWWSTSRMRCGSRRRSSPIALRMLYDATVRVGPLLTREPITTASEWFLDVEIGDAECVVLDELAARFDDVAHQPREDLIGD